MKFVTVFLRVNRYAVLPIAGFEPAPPDLSGRATFIPEGQINHLYSDNLKPQVTVMSLIFERSRASGSNRST